MSLCLHPTPPVFSWNQYFCVHRSRDPCAVQILRYLLASAGTVVGTTYLVTAVAVVVGQ